MNDIFAKVLNIVCLDDRIADGTFRVEKPEHINILREYMIKRFDIPERVAIQQCNTLMEKGEHPERQAYNKDGLLVTFPTEKHKQEKIAAGTHFEKDPTKPAPNVFDNGETAPVPGQPSPAPQPPQPAATPSDQSAQSGPSPDTQDQTQPSVPTPPPAPAPATQLPPTAASAPVEPDKITTPQEKAATAAVIKQILQSDDSVLEEVSNWLAKKVPLPPSKDVS